MLTGLTRACNRFLRNLKEREDCELGRKHVAAVCQSGVPNPLIGSCAPPVSGPERHHQDAHPDHEANEKADACTER
jgi:hypothetical protein